MTAIGLDHLQVCIPPGTEETARAFWSGIIGLEEVPQAPELNSVTGCWFRLGAVGLHIGVQDPFVPSQKAHPALRISDRAALDVLVARLEAAGHPVEWAEVPVAEARCKVRDPFGNQVELVVGTTG